MNTHKHLLTILIACLVAFAGCSDSPQLDFSGGAATPDELAEQFIQAMNAQDPALQKSIIHPLSFTNLSAAQERFMTESLGKDLQRGKVPADRDIVIKELEGDGLPFDDEVDWPIAPTHYLTIAFATGELSDTIIFESIVHDHDRWWIVVPMLKAEYLGEL